MCQSVDLRPALDEAIVGKSLGRALLALAKGVEPVGKFAGDLGFVPSLPTSTAAAPSPPASRARIS